MKILAVIWRLLVVILLIVVFVVLVDIRNTLHEQDVSQDVSRKSEKMDRYMDTLDLEFKMMEESDRLREGIRQDLSTLEDNAMVREWFEN